MRWHVRVWGDAAISAMMSVPVSVSARALADARHGGSMTTAPELSSPSFRLVAIGWSEPNTTAMDWSPFYSHLSLLLVCILRAAACVTKKEKETESMHT